MLQRTGIIILFAGLLLISFVSCKEKNELYPPLPWESYFFGNSQVNSRPVSALLIESDHSEWYGSQDDQGILLNNGYDWSEYNNSNVSVPFDSVTSILRDGNGLLWVSWKNGLANFDGNTWRSIDGLKGKRISNLALQGIGIIWIGILGEQQTGGLARWENGKLDFFTPSNSGLPSSQVTALTFDNEQRLWIGTHDQGIIIYNGVDWITPDLTLIGFIPAAINSLFTDKEGNVYAGTEASQVIKLSGDQIIVLNTGSSSPITSLLVDANGKIWIGTKGGGVLAVSEGIWKSYTAENMHLPGNSILALCKHPDGRILASFEDGHIISFKK
jgi:ligand-binding sensor domain-containing protein